MDQSHDDEGLERQSAWWKTEHAGYAGHQGDPAPRPDSPWSRDATQTYDPASLAGAPPAGPAWGPTEPTQPAGQAPPPWAQRPDEPTLQGPAPWAADPHAGEPQPDRPSWAPGAPGGPSVPPRPPWAGYGFPTPPAAGPVPPGPSPRRRGLLRAAAVVAVVAATTAAGIGVGHDLWHNTSSASPPSPSSSTTPPSNNGNGTGNGLTPGSSGNTGSGGSPSGNGGEFPGFFPGSGGNTGSGGSSSASGAPANASAIAAKVDPGLVDVVTTLGYQGGEAAGTGIVLTPNGEILTNNHVIDGATNIQVTDIGNGHTYTATVVGYNRTSDVAVLQLQGASGLTTASIGDSSKVAVGNGVVAIGNAGGVGGTPSAAGGSVTALDQTITASDEDGANSETLTGLIQINANIQPGDSGGSLVNTSGQVIGMDTAASSGFVASEKEGYAIPIDAATTIAQEIEAGQASSTVHIGRTGFLGVSVSSPQSGGNGAQIQSVVPGLPAETAGLSAGDTITALDGHAVSSPNGLTNLLLQQHPGDTIQLTYTDSSGQQHTVSVTLANGPAQ